MDYPRPLESIHQIEVSSRCNLRCTYCPSPKLDRPLDLPLAEGGGFGRAKQDITDQHFARALEWAQFFERRGTQGELALTGIGEAILHPNIERYVRDARAALPTNPITLSTNGLAFTEDHARLFQECQVALYVSLHRPEKAKAAVDLGRRYGILHATNTAFATEAFDWAGSLPEWSVSIPAESVTCEFLRSGWSVVLADGRFAACCLDAAGESMDAHVDQEPGSVYTAPWEGTKASCESCHMVVP